MQNELKHFEPIQGMIDRVSTNAFLLKGRSVVWVSALYALSSAKADQTGSANSHF